ncbi:hypothetical protein B4123_4042 [Bacillus paralicheniformis]|uniref:Uncharacterized protein n=1 Tax=Bacillus paralicheniformis TaxID=1648923 RepID=A0A6N2FU73_9BACI|nr:hypothetical protein B4121_3985 [Bacillus paralicheniformis]OLG03730.1 hypothetical protein B4123_4042 [Bacillus paralicheniformis]OLG07026.1 hypothetical protein B4125_1207 [Bacillus paralicheniformis]TWJ45369.1 hypothetical protein CHCC5027_2110 [Bacillus paralicheniformis]TWJ67641.1 hypothetical protein CHCC5021_2480 [Bacillus paralicheniformis]
MKQSMKRSKKPRAVGFPRLIDGILMLKNFFFKSLNVRI